MIAAAFFALTVLLVPGLSGGGTTPRWALTAVVLPLLMPDRRTAFTLAHLFGVLFLAYAAISVTWSHHWDGLDTLIKLVVIAEAFVLGSKLEDIKPVIIGCGLGIWVSSLVILTGIDVPHTRENAGLFVNSNSMGEIAALVLVAAVWHRLWWLVPGILPAFVLAQSRGAFVAVACAFVLWVWSKSRLAALALGGLCMAAGWLMATSPSSQDRLQMWADVLPHLTWAGHGLGSFFSQFPFYATMDTMKLRPEHLHNDWLEFVFETGIGAVFLLAFLYCCRSIVLAVLVVEACFGFPTHVAATAVLGGIVAGHAVWRRAYLCDDVDAGRLFLFDRPSRVMGGTEARGVGVPAQL